MRFCFPVIAAVTALGIAFLPQSSHMPSPGPASASAPRLERQRLPPVSKPVVLEAVHTGHTVPAKRPAINPTAKARLAESYGKLPLSFESNAGQAPANIKFLSRGSGYGLYLTRTGAVLSLARENRRAIVNMEFEGASRDSELLGTAEQPGKSNYFLGDNPAKWYTNVSRYGRVEYRKLYPGIDLVYYGNQRQLEYDVVVGPGADPGQVRMRFDGVADLRLDASGDLMLVTGSGEIRQRKPVIYQTVNERRVPVNGRYVIRGKHQVSFELASYDRRKPLVIDPVLVYSTYLGGSAGDFANDIAVDAAGNAYIVGGTDSADFPVPPPVTLIPAAVPRSAKELGVATADNQPQADAAAQATTFARAAFVTKLSPDGTQILYTTYLAGSQTSWALGVAIDSQGNAYVTGLTDSADFPKVTPLQASLGGGRDAFVTKLNPSGDTLIYSTFLGGSAEDFGAGIAVDSTFNAYVTGTTASANFPTQNPIQAQNNGSGDAFLAKINPSGGALVYSTFIGGSQGDSGERVSVDSSGNAYVAGATESTNFPVQAAAQAANAGGVDAFVTKVNPAGTAYVYSTYLGGSATDWGLSIATDASGSAYLSGYTQSTNFKTASPLQAANAGGADAFVSKLSPAGALTYSTYLGGAGDDYGYGVAVDAAGNAYVAGSTTSPAFPGTVVLLSPAAQALGGRDAFLSKLNPSGVLLSSNQFGGSNSDEAASVAVDQSGNAYVTGSTSSSDFPVLSAAQSSTGGAYDAFVTKFGTCTFTFSPATSLPQVSGTGGTLTVSVTSQPGCVFGAVSGSPWITLTSGSPGSGSGTVVFTVAPNSVTGTRFGQITIAGTVFSVVQSGGSSISVSPTQLFLSAQLGTPVSQSIVIGSTFPSLTNFTASPSVSSPTGGTWLSVSPASGSVGDGVTSTLTVTANTAGLNPGTYTGAINVTAPGATNKLTIPVSFTVNAPVLSATPNGLSFVFSAGSSAPPPQTVSISGNGARVSFTVSSSGTIPGGPTWLSVTPTTGSTQNGPVTLTASVSVVNLSPGTYNGSITVTTSAGSPLTIPVRLVVSANQLLSVSPGTVVFDYAVGSSSLPPSQTIPIGTSISSMGYSAVVSTSAAAWLHVSPTNGLAPGSSTISVTPAGLAPGTYTGTITYSGPFNSQVVPVQFNVFTNFLEASPSDLSFTFQTGGAAPPGQNVSVSLAYCCASVPFTVTTSPAVNWLSLNYTAGQTGTSGDTFTVSVNPSGLQPGNYSTSLVISSSSGATSQTVPVTLSVTRPLFTANPNPIFLSYQVGQGASGSTTFQNVAISTGGGPVTYAAAASSAGWLSVSPSSGTTPSSVTVTANPAAVAAGTYQGFLNITSTAAGNSPLSVPVTFVVNGLAPSPASLSFGSFSGASAPVTRTVSLGGFAPNITSSVTTAGGGNWLSATLTSGDFTSASVSVNPTGLAAGTYTGSVKLTPADSPTNAVTIPVTYILSVAPTLTVPSGTVTFNYTLGSPAPAAQTVAVSSTGSQLGFRAAPVTASGGNWLSAFPRSMTPENLSISVLPGTLAVGTYNGSVVVTSPDDAIGPKTIPVTLVIASQASINAQPSPLTFGAVVGTSPASKTLAVNLTPAGAAPSPYTASVEVTTPPSGTWLAVSPQSGTLTPSASTLTVSVNSTGLAPGTYTGNIVISAPGTGNTPLRVPVTLTVVSSFTITTPCPVSGGVVNQSYALQFAGVGGVQPYFWNPVTLPPGLSLNSGTGLLSGIPTQVGSNPISIQGFDSSFPQQSRTYTCTINFADVLRITAPVPGPGGIQGLPYSFPITATGGTIPLSWTLNASLPQGLTLNSATGVISGTSGVSGTFRINVTVTDSGAGNFRQTATYLGDIIIAPKLNITAPCPAPSGVPNVAYSFPVTAAGGTGALNWQLTSGPLPTGLTLNSTTGVIGGTTTQSGTFPITVKVTDSGSGSLQQTATYTCNIVITAVLTITAPCPALSGVPNVAYSFPVSAAGGTGALSWQLTSGPLPTGLTLNSTTGVISGTPTQSGTFPITVKVTDSGVTGAAPQTATYTCNIVITATLTITAACPALSGVPNVAYSFPVSAAGGTGALNWQLTSGPLPTGLTLNSATGVISGTPTQSGTFPITVTVKDSATGTLQQSATYACNIVITAKLAITAPCPAINGVPGAPYSFAVSAIGGTGALSWQLTSGPLPAGLALDSSTGVISGTPTASGTFPITVTVTDSGFGTQQQTAVYSCSITITARLSITALCPAASGIPNSPYSFTVFAIGGTGALNWQLATGPLAPGLTLNSATGVISGTPTQSGTFPITVKVTDSGVGSLSQSATYTCNIVIATALTITTPCPAASGVPGSPYTFSVSTTGGQGQLSWQLTSGPLPAGLSLNSSTGIISGTPTVSGTFPITVTVSDSGEIRQTATYTCSIVIASSLSITAPCPANTGSQGLPYSFTVSAVGGTGALNWQLAGGPLPPGLSLNSATGVISGTATASGTFPITVTVADSGGQTLQQKATYSCNIVIAPTLVILAPCPATSGVQGTPYSFAVLAAGGQGVLSWQLASGPLPPGLTLNSATGVISGTPTASGTFPITVRVIDSAVSALLQSATYICNIVITATLAITAPCPALSGVPNVAYSFPITATGGAGALNWQLTSSPLPTGLTLNSATGVISGTPTQSGTFPITVTVKDSGIGTLQQSATYTCNLVITAKLAITAPCPAINGVPGAPYSFAVSAIGGTGTLSWQLTSGPLPSGLTLDSSTGVISGTPTASGTFPITVTVTDSGFGTQQQTAVYSCSITITARLSITALCPAASGIPNSPYSFTVSAIGGTGALNWQLASGPLPAGVTLNSATGVISGTPTQSGTFPITVKVTDSGVGSLSQSATYTCNIVIATTLTITAPCPAASGVPGVSYSFAVSTTGGQGALTWQLTGGTLPAGLSLNSTTGLISGTPTVSGTFPITVTVADSGEIRQTATYTCSIVIAASLSITAPCPANVGVQGLPYSFPISTVGGQGSLLWQLAGGSLPPGLSLNSATGVISGTPPASGSFPFSVKVTDSGVETLQQTATYTCSIVIAPTLAIAAACPAASGVQGSPYSFAISAVGGQGVLVWQLVTGTLPPGLTLNSATGVINGSPTASGTFPIAVRVVDSGIGGFQQVAVYSCNIVVISNPTVTAACPATTGVQASPYAFSITVTGGQSPYRWQLASGTLPAGLSLNTSTGVISGTPAANGTFPISVRITDAGQSGLQQSVTYTCAIVVAPALSIGASCPAAAGVQGSPYTFPIAVSGGVAPYTWKLTGNPLPAGLALNAATGVISGTPTVSGTFPITVQVSDNGTGYPYAGQTATYSCSIVILPALTITSGCPAAGSINSAFSFTVTAGGGTAPYTFALANGSSLPAGLSLNAATGVISGAATATGTVPVSIRVTDSGIPPLQQSQTFSCGISINAPQLQITSGCPGSAVQGSPYAATLTASGGNGGFTWSISQGGLPAGLSLNGSRIGGTPAGPPGTTNFSIQVSSGDQSAQLACSMTVGPPQVQITSGCPADGTQGVPYAPFILIAAGGSGPGTYAFSIVGGSLPAGLSLNGNAITGTPQGPPGPAQPFTIQATSGGASAATGPCSINIAAAPLVLTGTCPATAQAGTLVSTTVTASGGRAPYTFNFSGSPWLHFSNGTVSGTPPPEAGTGSFSVTVSDAANSAPKTFSCSFPTGPGQNPGGLQAISSCPAGPIPLNTPFSLSIDSSGGKEPYTWSLSGPAWLSLSSTAGASVTLSGTPPSIGPAPFTVTLTDSSGSSTRFNCSVTVVAPALQITPSAGCPATPIDFQSAVSVTLSATGGTAPYAWSFSGPSWLSLSSKAGATTTVSGVATASGATSFSVTLNDSANTPPATYSCSLTVNPAVVPPITFTVSPSISLTPVGVVLSLSSPAPEDLSGTVTVTFKSTATNPLDNNPQVHFSNPNATQFPFTITKGAQTVTLPNVEQGSVAGTIHLEITSLKAGSDNVLSGGPVSADLVVPKLKPVITNQFPAPSPAGLSFENETANGFDIVISGYSTPRDMTSVTVTFAPRTGATLEGDATFTVPVTNLFTAFYQSQKSFAAGSMFEGMRIPVSVGGDKDAIGSVTVTLTNSVGTSDPVTKSR